MLLYYLLIGPVSKIPLPVLYFLSSPLRFILERVAGYRKKVVEQNLRAAFPQLPEAERKAIMHRYFRHLSRILVEGIRNLGIGERKLRKRMQLGNPELFRELYEEGHSVVLVSSHFENWEYFITAQALLIPHKAFGIGKKISKAYLNKKINALRERFGMTVIHQGNYRDELEKAIKKQPVAVLTLADQSPAPDQAYWATFLGLPTPFAYGSEYMAHRFGMAVVYLDISQPRPGYYLAEGRLICKSPSGLPYGAIMDEIVRMQQEQVLKKPEAWLWSHRRWKHAPPENPEAYRRAQEDAFRKRFE